MECIQKRVNDSAYNPTVPLMDFKTATDRLFRTVTHAELAERLGCSVATIRQARLDPRANAHRSPPAGWQDVVRELARERALDFSDLAAGLDQP